MKQIESFFWGIIAAFGALIVQFIIFTSYFLYKNPTGNLSFASFFSVPIFIIIAAAVEEIFKYLIISKRVDSFSLEKSYIFNSFLVGLGFFAVELGIIMQSTKGINLEGLGEIAILHMGTAGLMGHQVATRNPGKFGTFLIAVAMAVFFHGSYNLLSMNQDMISNYATMALLALLLLANLVNIFRISSQLAQH